ncbi:FecCD family ABC transporter permease [Microbacterium foliorum]|uniref:FecCD family ABC transporter permease n=1 Tax=Microbacterium foliorum TaxID=104336 RepID=UPI001D7CF4C0|nr:iron chelate uptake ABC transporter family permease subunit [Microbacterium foliorum]CAH0234971.1 Ferric enterobactin transport system permease protein FepG [Microbacterium foliorum]CAH0247300.1 Ferric enterobactin transport system permease protein FepG [Microbacterium foliorum]
MSADTRMSLRQARRTLDRRGRIAMSILVAALLTSFVAGLSIGDTVLSPIRVVQALFETDGGIRMVVVDWRLPRALAAVFFGAALALSGTVFQTITRNPLGSPDVIGLTTGAYTGALIVMTSGSGSGLAVAIGAILGGFGTAVLVALLIAGRGALGYRIVIVGIGVSAVLAAVNAWMLLRARREVAVSAAIWDAGTLNGAGWNQALLPILVVSVLIVVLLCAQRGLWLVELGDDIGSSLGGRMGATKAGLVAIAVGLTGVVTAVIGPVAFIALAAPHLARLIVRNGPAHLVATALMGATLLSLADIIAQNAVPKHALPVGVVTLVLGGVYLMFLVVRTARRRF